MQANKGDYIMDTFGDRLRALRLSKGLSLRDLADICETSKSAIHMYEVNKRNPKIETLEALSDTFNVDIDYLLCKTDVKNSVAEQFGFSSLEEAYRAGALGDFPLSNPTISPNRQKLIDLAMSVPEDKVDPLYQALQAILAIQK
jgi:transcriptional regulator with XRE-family HTH domain